MPDWKSYLRERLSLPGMKGHREERMISELADHLEDVYQEALARGASEEEARAEAEGWLGDAGLATDELLRSEPAHVRAQLGRWMDAREEGARRKGGAGTFVADLARDLRFAVRSLAKRPLFSAVVVLVLALGIGATTAIFTLLDAIILSPLPFDDAGRLVSVSHSAPALGVQNAGQCAAWHFTYEDENRVFEDIGMYTPSLATITGGGEPQAVRILWVTSGVFRALRLRPVVGRIFTREDEELDAPNVALLGYGYWQSRFGGNPDVVGQTIEANAQTFEIVGVMPAQLQSLGTNPLLIFPLRYNRSTLFVGNIGFGGVARLRDGVTVEEANADAARMLPLAFEKFPGGPVADFSERARYTPNIQPLKDNLVGSVANLLWIIMAGVGVVLLIACANVANLFLVRSDGKETEMAIRSAMGASRARIAWEYLKESLSLGVLGGVGGLALANFGLDALVAAGPANLPRLDEVSMNWGVLAFALIVSLGAGAFFGMFPVLRQSRAAPVDALKEGGRSGTTGKRRQRAQNALAVSQMALALVLLVASGLMFRTFVSLWKVDPGFHNPENVLALRLFISGNEIPDPAETAATHERIARRLAEIPGVQSVALATAVPMDGNGNVNPLYVDGFDYSGDQTPSIRRHKWIGGGYLETLQIPLLLGRTLTWQDVRERAPAVLVSESLAREYWGSPQAALGQRVSVRSEPSRWYEVVGVVADVREDGLGQDPPPMVYWPQVTLAFWEGDPPDQVRTWRDMGYAIRSDRIGTAGFVDEVRAAVWEINPDLPVRGLQSLDNLMGQSIARTSFTLTLLGVAAGVALLLGVIGVYGVISYAVSQRSRELGLRMAMGAQAGQVKRMVVRQGLVLSAVGVAIGLALAFGLTRLMSGLLFGVSPVDPLTFLAVAAVLIGVALVASYLPARRAAGVDPMEVLRAE
jgi:putative ABC transport system permease protein